MELSSDLWLDQADAHERIDARFRVGALAEDLVPLMHDFVEDGFVRIRVDLDEKFFSEFEDQVGRAWRERPSSLAVSPIGPDRPVAFADFDGVDRAPGYRIPDFHNYSSAALDLYLHPTIFAMIEILFDRPAIAFQSLYFEYGSSQPLHRDPMFVPTDPATHLLASWTALEDIAPDAGPLEYVPGSHREPWFEFEPGSVVRRPSAPPERILRWQDEVATLTERTPALRFTAQRGETFIWHGGLFHGGAPVQDPTRTRKSFVVHYSTAHSYKGRTVRMRTRNGDEWQTLSRETKEVVTRGSTRGLVGPFSTEALSAEDSVVPADRLREGLRHSPTTPKVRMSLSDRLRRRGRR